MTRKLWLCFVINRLRSALYLEPDYEKVSCQTEKNRCLSTCVNWRDEDLCWIALPVLGSRSTLGEYWRFKLQKATYGLKGWRHHHRRNLPCAREHQLHRRRNAVQPDLHQVRAVSLQVCLVFLTSAVQRSNRPILCQLTVIYCMWHLVRSIIM